MHEGQEGTLGSCSICSAVIEDDRTLVEYETSGSRRVYVECPDCLNIVHPE